MTDLTKIDQPFGTLPRATQMALFEAHLNKEIIECNFEQNYWLHVLNPSFMSKAIYRVQPVPITYDSINWDHVAPAFIAMARGITGNTYLYSLIPEISSISWFSANGFYRQVDSFNSYKRGTCDWKDSLVLRPKGGV